MVIGGVFWMDRTPGKRVRGVYRAAPGAKPEAALQSNLVDDPRVLIHRERDGQVAGFAVSADPERSVASFLPVTLHGLLDDGQPITVLVAQNYGRAGAFSLVYRGSAAIVGAHVSDNERYSELRFRMDRPHWTAHLQDGASCVVPDDESRLVVSASPDGNWLVYEAARTSTLRQLELRALSGCLAFLHLAVHPDESRVIRATRIRLGPAAPWL